MAAWAVKATATPHPHALAVCSEGEGRRRSCRWHEGPGLLARRRRRSAAHTRTALRIASGEAGVRHRDLTKNLGPLDSTRVATTAPHGTSLPSRVASTRTRGSQSNSVPITPRGVTRRPRVRADLRRRPRTSASDRRRVAAADDAFALTRDNNGSCAPGTEPRRVLPPMCPRLERTLSCERRLAELCCVAVTLCCTGGP